MYLLLWNLLVDWMESVELTFFKYWSVFVHWLLGVPSGQARDTRTAMIRPTSGCSLVANGHTSILFALEWVRGNSLTPSVSSVWANSVDKVQTVDEMYGQCKYLIGWSSRDDRSSVLPCVCTIELKHRRSQATVRLLALIVNYLKIASAFGFYVGFGLCKNVGIDWLFSNIMLWTSSSAKMYTLLLVNTPIN